MTSPPSISVVLPVRDDGRFLETAIRSVLEQTYRDLELIVVDDGSTDDSGDISDAAARTDPRVRVLHRRAEGISAALNAGLAVARGSWFARIDADDIALPTRLERQWRAAQRLPEVVLWGSWAHLFVGDPDERSMIARVGPTTVAEFVHIRRHGPPLGFIHPTVMMRRDVLVDVGGYDSRFDGAEDVELFDRIAERGPALSLPEPLIYHRVRSDGYNVRRFTTGREVTRYVSARVQARRDGRECPDWEGFRYALSRRSFIARSLSRVRDRGEWLAGRSDIEFLEGRVFRAAALKLLAAGLEPSVACRVVRRILHGSARRLSAGRA